jgi:dTMP kinase
MFITFEGGEGAGKSTLMLRFSKALEKEGRKALLTREPGGTAIGEEIRKLLLEKKQQYLFSKTELFLFLAARAQHIEEVLLPALERGEVVLCDRFSDSTIAYQGVKLGVPYVEECCQLALQGFEPDLTFYIDIDPHVGMGRVLKRSQGKKDRIEERALEYHEEVRVSFLYLAEKYPERIITLDGTEDPDTLFKTAYGRFLDIREK